MTICTSAAAWMSRSGLPRTNARSASRPRLTVPRCASRPITMAGSAVTVRSASYGVKPYSTNPAIVGCRPQSLQAQRLVGAADHDPAGTQDLHVVLREAARRRLLGRRRLAVELVLQRAVLPRVEQLHHARVGQDVRVGRDQRGAHRRLGQRHLRLRVELDRVLVARAACRDRQLIAQPLGGEVRARVLAVGQRRPRVVRERRDADLVPDVDRPLLPVVGEPDVGLEDVRLQRPDPVQLAVERALVHRCAHEVVVDPLAVDRLRGPEVARGRGARPTARTPSARAPRTRGRPCSSRS